ISPLFRVLTGLSQRLPVLPEVTGRASPAPLRDTLTSAYIMFLHRRHASQHRIERLQRRHFSRQLSVRQRRRASASSSEEKIPSAEAAMAAPVSFIALPRVIAPVCRPVARSSNNSSPRFINAPLTFL